MTKHVRSALNSAVKRRLIAWSPAVHVELPSPDPPEAAVWSPDELETFLKAHADHRLYALFHLIVVAGLRRGEALGLRWVDVDMGQRMIRVRQQLLDAPGSPVFGPTKTRSGVRRVPLDAATIDVLEAHRQQQENEAAQARAVGVWTASGLVFTRQDGQWLRPDWVTHEFQRMIRVAGVPALRLHDLRHTSASLALAAGVPMQVVSARLGHSSLAITADLYTHVSPAVADEAADRIGSLVRGRDRTPQHRPDGQSP